MAVQYFEVSAKGHLATMLPVFEQEPAACRCNENHELASLSEALRRDREKISIRISVCRFFNQYKRFRRELSQGVTFGLFNGADGFGLATSFTAWSNIAKRPKGC